MKKPMLWCLAWCLLMSGDLAWGADVQFSYGDFSQVAQTKRPLTVYPLLVSATNSAGITTGDRIARVTGLDGTITISNIMPGWVRADFHGLWTVTTNFFLVPDTNGLIRAQDCLQTNLLFGGTLPFPAPWWGRAELLAGNNTTFRTNSGKTYIDTSAGGGGGGSTNANFATNAPDGFPLASTHFVSTNAPASAGFTYDVSKWGAVGDCLQLSNAAIAQGSYMLTDPSANFLRSDTNKNVEVVGAGGVGVGAVTNLATTIATWVSATTVLLRDPALSTVTTNQAYYGHSDAAGLNAIMDAADAADKDCIIQLEPGKTYFIDGPYLQEIGGTNWSLLRIPERGFLQRPISIVIQGAAPPSFASTPFGAGQPFGNGESVLVFARTPTNGVAGDSFADIVAHSCGIGYPLPCTGSAFGWNCTKVTLRNLVVRTFDNPTVSPIRFDYVDGSGQYGRSDTGMLGTRVAQPTFATYGYSTPKGIGFPGGHFLDWQVEGYNTGWKVESDTTVDRVRTMLVNNVFEFGRDATAGLNIGYIWASWFGTGLVYNAVNIWPGANIAMMDFEVCTTNQAGQKPTFWKDWLQVKEIVHDPNNNLHGTLNMSLTSNDNKWGKNVPFWRSGEASRVAWRDFGADYPFPSGWSGVMGDPTRTQLFPGGNTGILERDWGSNNVPFLFDASDASHGRMHLRIYGNTNTTYGSADANLYGYNESFVLFNLAKAASGSQNIRWRMGATYAGAPAVLALQRLDDAQSQITSTPLSLDLADNSLTLTGDLKVNGANGESVRTSFVDADGQAFLNVTGVNSGTSKGGSYLTLDGYQESKIRFKNPKVVGAKAQDFGNDGAGHVALRALTDDGNNVSNTLFSVDIGTGNLTVTGTNTAAVFSGSGSGLTGIANSLSVSSISSGGGSANGSGSSVLFEFGTNAVAVYSNGVVIAGVDTNGMFTGKGTGLTGTAAGLSVGGSSASAAVAANLNGQVFSNASGSITFYGSGWVATNVVNHTGRVVTNAVDTMYTNGTASASVDYLTGNILLNNFDNSKGSFKVGNVTMNGNGLGGFTSLTGNGGPNITMGNPNIKISAGGGTGGDGGIVCLNGLFTGTLTSPVHIITNSATIFAPTPATIGANNGAMWVSNHFLYYSWTADGSASNAAVKIAP